MANQYTAISYVTETEAQCSACKKIKPHNEFHKCEKYKYRKGCSYYCKECANTKAKANRLVAIDKDEHRYKRMKRSNAIKLKYGITLQEYEAKLEQQGNCCSICGMKLPNGGQFTHLDHCHKTGKLRAFLCTNCNRGLGHFKESTKYLMRAVEYLNSHNDNGNHRKD